MKTSCSIGTDSQGCLLVDKAHSSPQNKTACVCVSFLLSWYAPNLFHSHQHIRTKSARLKPQLQSIRLGQRKHPLTVIRYRRLTEQLKDSAVKGQTQHLKTGQITASYCIHALGSRNAGPAMP